MKRTILMLTIVSLLIAVPAMAKKGKGDVPAPEWISVEILDDDITFDWEDAEGAEKYSLDIEGAGWVLLVGDTEPTWVEFEVSYSSVASLLTMPVQDVLDDLTLAILAELGGIAMEDVDSGELLELDAKVKGLDPHSEDVDDVKRQNNPFSKYNLMVLFGS